MPVDAAVDRAPSWNVAPTQPVRAVVERPGQGRLVVTLRWGLVPPWAKGLAVGSRMINCRAETAATKAVFRAGLSGRRVLVPADGFYEWRRTPGDGRGGKSQPYWFHRADGDLAAFGGLWGSWRDVAGELVRTFTLVTTEASTDMGDIHHRMPLILEPEQWDEWLGPATGGRRLGGLMVPAAPGTLAHHPVGATVNRPTEDGPDLVAVLGAGLA